MKLWRIELGVTRDRQGAAVWRFPRVLTDTACGCVIVSAGPFFGTWLGSYCYSERSR